MLPIRFRATVVRGVALASLLLAARRWRRRTQLDATMQAQLAARPAAPPPAAPLHESPCVAGMAAGTYPCHNVDLVAFVPVASVGASTTNSLWGWTDPQDGTEYALVGLNNGVAFFDLGVPDHPLYLGKLPTHTGSSIWRDVRVHANHAYVVSDNNGAHGMQVFDLTRLRNVAAPPVSFTEDAHYAGQPGGTVLGRGHTININPATGYAYIPGTNTCPAPTANGALHMVDIRSPASPVFAGCVTTGSYTHETSCVTYQGPDSAHAGKEICFNANGPTDRIAIVDVSNKAAPVTLASLTYPGSGYPHQGDLTSDHRYLLLNDELDESQFGHNAKTLVWDVSDLDLPVLVGAHTHALGVIDHNLYVHDNHVYESNYESGFRVLRIDNLSQAQLTEIAYFDTYPASNAPEFNGNWNNYRFPGSGLVIASGIDEGLFVLRPRLCEAPPAPTALVAGANGDNRIDLAWTGSGRVGARFVVERAQGGCGGVFTTVASDLAGTAYSDTTASGGVAYGYRVSESAGAMCGSAASACVSRADHRRVQRAAGLRRRAGRRRPGHGALPHRPGLESGHAGLRQRGRVRGLPRRRQRLRAGARQSHRRPRRRDPLPRLRGRRRPAAALRGARDRPRQRRRGAEPRALHRQRQRAAGGRHLQLRRRTQPAALRHRRADAAGGRAAEPRPRRLAHHQRARARGRCRASGRPRPATSAPRWSRPRSRWRRPPTPPWPSGTPGTPRPASTAAWSRSRPTAVRTGSGSRPTAATRTPSPAPRCAASRPAAAPSPAPTS